MAVLTVVSATFAQGQSANQTSLTPANGPFGGPILVTPTVTLPTPAPTAGISDAGRAGFSSVGASSAAPVEPAAYSTSSVDVGNDSGSAAPANPPAEQPTNDLEPSVSIISVNSGPESAAPSAYGVVEASGRYKNGNNAHKARILSNEDVERMLSSKVGVNMAKKHAPAGGRNF
ncbi:MAG TPA: hypothetical protein VH724_17660 [Candidatus Angelobacter sp.]|nr:hypothetical protein [Candidatus Angelobacter sp.]